MVGVVISALTSALVFAVARCWGWRCRAMLAEKRLDRLRESPALSLGSYPVVHVTECGRVFVVHRAVVARALLESYMD